MTPPGEILDQVFSESFTGFMEDVLRFIPNFIFAVVIVAVGWLLGSLVGRAVTQVSKVIKIRDLLSNTGIDKGVEHLGVRFKPELFLGKFVQWIIMILALMAAFEQIGLSRVNAFLEKIISYIPSIFVVVLILIIASFVAELLRKIVMRSAMAARIEFAGVVGSITKWSVLTLAIFASLFELGIATTFIQTSFTGLVAAVALALGLSFGIGGYPHAQEFIGSIRKQFRKENNPEHYPEKNTKGRRSEKVVDELDEEDLKRDLQREE